MQRPGLVLPSLNKLACSIGFLLCLAILSPACSRHEVNAGGYLGSDELLARISQATSISLNQVDGLSGVASASYCPLPEPGDELYPFVQGITDLQRQRMISDLGSAGFRSTLKAALQRLHPTLESPPEPWSDSDEARLPSTLPSAGEISTWFHGAKIDPYSIRMLVRVVLHEAVHVVLDGADDDEDYHEFVSVRQYANYVGACLALRISSAFRMDGHYHATVNGAEMPLVIRAQSETRISGYAAAVPGGPSRNFEGTVEGNAMQFVMVASGVSYLFRGNFEVSAGRRLLQGEFIDESAPGAPYPWRAAERTAYFSEFKFINFTTVWDLVEGVWPDTSVTDQLRGQSSATYARPRATVSPPPVVAVSLNFTVLSASSAGVLVTDKNDPRKFVMLAPGVQSGAAYLYVWRAGQTSPISASSLPMVPESGGIGGHLAVQKCGESLVAYVNGKVITSLSLGAAAIQDLSLDLSGHHGLIISGTNARLTGYVVSERIYDCPTAP